MGSQNRLRWFSLAGFGPQGQQPSQPRVPATKTPSPQPTTARTQVLQLRPPSPSQPNPAPPRTRPVPAGAVSTTPSPVEQKTPPTPAAASRFPRIGNVNSPPQPRTVAARAPNPPGSNATPKPPSPPNPSPPKNPSPPPSANPAKGQPITLRPKMINEPTPAVKTVQFRTPPPSPTLSVSSSPSASAATPTAFSSKVVINRANTQASSPKTISTTSKSPPEIKPMSPPPAQINPENGNKPNVPPEAEQKMIIPRSSSTGSKQEYHDKPVKYTYQKDKADGFGKRIITIAGENRGAILELNTGPRKEGESKGSIGSEEERGAAKMKEMESQHKMLFINSNVQGINNAILFHGSFTQTDPGVRLSLSD